MRGVGTVRCVIVGWLLVAVPPVGAADDVAPPGTPGAAPAPLPPAAPTVLPAEPVVPPTSLLGSPDVPADYQVDSGDVLAVLVPRYAEFSRVYPVDSRGNIAVDLVGELSVRGLTTAEIEQRLAAALGQYLKYPENLSVRVAARRMTVRILGQVGQPGLREVPRDANVQEILSLAGGPQLGAIVTRIVIRRRSGDWIEDIPVDLKAYLEGRGKLPELRNGDEIFVPRVETDDGVQRPLTVDEVTDPEATGRAQVIGAVRQPGEVPVRDGASLLKVLTKAGGWLETADLARIRRVPGGDGQAEVFDLQSFLDQGGSVPRIFPGDVISVPSRIAATRTVRVVGAVAQPGPIQLPADADLQAALTAAGGALPAGDTRHIKVLRRDGAELERREFDLEAYLASGDPALLPDLRTGDVVFVPKGNVALQTPSATVYVFGAVAKPGPYPLVDQRPLLYLLAQAGGTLPTANLHAIKIARAGGGQRLSTFDLQAFQNGEGGQLPELLDGDTVTVEPNRVTVVGDVLHPGQVEVRTDGTVVEAITAVGGPSPTADLSRVILSRAGPQGVERRTINLEQYLYEPAQAPPVPTVLAGDVIAVESGTLDSQVAYVLGAVARPGVVALPGRRASVLYALAQAGGVLPTADREQVRIVRPGPGGITTELFDLKGLVDGDTGRPNIRPPEVRAGDVVSVDELGKPGRGVLVLGAVARQGRVLVEEGQNVIDTIGLAGGLTANADPAHARLVRASGEVIDLNLGSYTQTGAASPKVQDGDVLAVAFRRETITIWDEILRLIPFVSFFIRR